MRLDLFIKSHCGKNIKSKKLNLQLPKIERTFILEGLIKTDMEIYFHVLLTSSSLQSLGVRDCRLGCRTTGDPWRFLGQPLLLQPQGFPRWCCYLGALPVLNLDS